VSGRRVLDKGEFCFQGNEGVELEVKRGGEALTSDKEQKGTTASKESESLDHGLGLGSTRLPDTSELGGNVGRSQHQPKDSIPSNNNLTSNADLRPRRPSVVGDSRNHISPAVAPSLSSSASIPTIPMTSQEARRGTPSRQGVQPGGGEPPRRGGLPRGGDPPGGPGGNEPPGGSEPAGRGKFTFYPPFWTVFLNLNNLRRHLPTHMCF
jgi:hypothetical protein